MNQLNNLVYESAAKDAALRVHAAIVVDADSGEVLYLSGLAETMFGYEAEELLGQAVEVLLPEAVRARHAAYRKEFAAHPRSRPMGHGMVLFGRKKDGGLFPVQVSLSPATVLAHDVVVAFVIDLSEPVKTAVRIQEIVEQPNPEANP